MIKVKEIDYDLSLKLGDPTNDKGDGERFHLQDRLKYLSRAYGRLLRNLEKLGREYQPHFARQIEPVELKLEGAEETSGAKISPVKAVGSIRRIIEMYVELPQAGKAGDKRETIFSVAHVDNDMYLSVKNGKNERYTPDYDNGKFYYTLMNGLIYLLPIKPNGYSSLSIVCQIDVPQLMIDSVINMSNDYRDLLITMAANEGMQDDARADKVQLYSRDIQNELQILGIATQKLEKDEGRVNG